MLVLFYHIIFFSLPPSDLQGKRIIEIGAGCGLVGIAAGMRGASVQITDLPEYVPLMESNIINNKSHIISSGGEVKAISLPWGTLDADQLSCFQAPVDFIVGSDIVYALQGFNELIATMVSLSDKNTVVLVAYEHR
eukprot:TRINITY_DN6987_c0_g1_i1.p1 TRINITY_DN6987_c0_g1~~TRINITY_DN6987_c0_g1_i1.p1  ORF type:complete len:136 (-),score=16.70 TRINITY_DN6987_c0_g1_i1:80-487(-)